MKREGNLSFCYSKEPLMKIFRRAGLPYCCVILFTNKQYQEPITRSLQLPHISVTAFSQTDLFLGLIYLEFKSPREPQ